MTEAQLVERAEHGDARAIRCLYERHSDRVWTVIRRVVNDDETASDCAQEAWMRAIRGLSSFRGDARFSTWIHRIAVNVAVEAIRRNGVRWIDGPVPDTLPDPHPPRDVLLGRRIEEALSRLPDGMRTVLVLHDVEGHTHEEIGRLLKVTTGASKSQLFKARAKMRQMLSAEYTPRDDTRHRAGAKA